MIECIKGDIVRQPDLDAVVNAANTQLAPGGGVAGAIHNAAGPGLHEACKPLAPIKPGEAVITPAFRLPNRFVIHCLGPVYGTDHPAEKLLADCYNNALILCEQNGVKRVGFPAISTGIFGYPVPEAAQTAIRTIRSHFQNTESGIELVRMVLWSQQDLDIFEKVLRQAG